MMKTDPLAIRFEKAGFFHVDGIHGNKTGEVWNVLLSFKSEEIIFASEMGLGKAIDSAISRAETMITKLKQFKPSGH